MQLDAIHQFERIALLCRILKDETPSSRNRLKILPVAEAVSKQPRFQARRAKQKRHRTGRNRRHRCLCQPDCHFHRLRREHKQFCQAKMMRRAEAWDAIKQRVEVRGMRDLQPASASRCLG